MRNHPDTVVLTAFLSTRAADLGDGYGFPSSHSQWMAYFATFLICHVGFRHRFTPTGTELVDFLLRLVVILGLVAWAGGVAYSRWAFALYDPAMKADRPHSSGSARFEVRSGLSFCLASAMGCWYWGHLWEHVLCPGGAHSDEKAQQLFRGN